MDAGELLLYLVIYFGLFTSIFFFLTLYDNKQHITSPRLKRYPFVSVMIPAYNEEATLNGTIDSLLGLDYPKNKLQIIVIDDGSTDSTLKIARQYEKQGILVLHKKNEGKGKALNYGLRYAKGELVCALDADSYADSKALRRMVGYFDDPTVIAVTPSLKVSGPTTIIQKIQYVEYLLGIYLRKVFAFLDAIHVTPGPFSVYRKSFFDKHGGYDHTTLTEDIEVALRIQSLHYRIENSSDAYVYTKSPANFKALLVQRIRWYRGFFDNVLRYKRLFSPKYGDLGLFILPASFISVALVIAVIFYTIFRITSDTYKQIVNLISIDFDFWKMVEFHFDWFYFDQSSLVLLSILTLVIGITMVVVARRLADEKIPLVAMYGCYMIVYMPLFAFWWLCALFYKCTGRKIRWGGREM